MQVKGYVGWIACLSLLIVPSHAVGGAWTLRAGEYYLELFNQLFYADTDFDASRDRVRKANRGRFDEVRVEIKAEAGILSDRFNLLFSLPIETAHFKDQNVNLRTTGVEEIRMGAKYRLTAEPSPVVVSGQLMSKFPGCDKKDQPPLADCQFDGEIRVLFSKGFLLHKDTKISQLFASLEVGYRLRAEDPADEIPYFFELGYNLWGPLWLKGTLDGVESRPFGGGAEEDFIKWTASLLISKDPSERRQRNIFGVEIGYGSVFAGKNTGAGQTVFLKLLYQF
jgi:hypothetical protein